MSVFTDHARIAAPCAEVEERRTDTVAPNIDASQVTQTRHLTYDRPAGIDAAARGLTQTFRCHKRGEIGYTD